MESKANKIEEININKIIEKIQEKLKEKEEGERLFVAIAGIGGAGKTTLANELKSKMNNCQVVSYDGYHIYRKDLTEEQLKYRGRFDTFNNNKFTMDFLSLKQQKQIKEEKIKEIFNFKFPSFDHSLKDPKEEDVIIEESTQIIIFEGLYLLIESLNIFNCFDVKVFVDSDLNEAMDRIVERNYKAGISNTKEESYQKTYDSDFKNAKFIVNNSKIDESTLVYKYI